MPMTGHLPILRGFSGYRRSWLRHDVTAGLAVAAVAIPSAIAYPAIAGLPVEVGLYASILPLVGYALFGPSHKLMLGPDAPTMTVLAAVLAGVPAVSPDERVATAAALAITVGIFCLLASRVGLGAIANFFSRPILIGFISGISISIMVGQIGRLTGVRIESDGLVAPVLELFRQLGLVHWPSVALGAAMLALLLMLPRLRCPVPGPLIVIVVAAIASVIFGFEGLGIKVVGSLPEALPALSIPVDARLPLPELVLGAGAVWLVSVSSGLVGARSFGVRGNFAIDANRELLGIGAANIASGLFSGFPVTMSDSRTAINLSAGGRSQLSGLVAAGALTALLLYLNNALRVLPVPALGAILVAAALNLIDVAGLRQTWRVSRMEFVFALISMWGAISLGVLSGVVIAIAGTLLYVLLKEMRPRDAVLGRIPGKPGFYKLHRAQEAQPVPGLTVCLIQGSVLFFNAEYVKARIEGIVEAAPAGTRWLVLNASAIAQLDSTAAVMFEQLRSELAARGVAFGLAEVNSDPLEILRRSGFLDALGPEMLFDDLEDAVRGFEGSRAADRVADTGQGEA
jgi:SulP family sulfate permease